MSETKRYASWSRLLHILQKLEAGPAEVSEVALAIGADQRVVRRDLGWLAENWPGVQSSRPGRAKLYWIEGCPTAPAPSPAP